MLQLCGRQRAQGVAVELVGRSQGQAVDKPDRTRVLIGGRIFKCENLQRALIEAAAFAFHYERHRLGALDFIVDRYDAGLDQPSAAYDLTGALMLAASRLPQLLTQITRYLDQALAAGC